MLFLSLLVLLFVLLIGGVPVSLLRLTRLLLLELLLRRVLLPLLYYYYYHAYICYNYDFYYYYYYYYYYQYWAVTGSLRISSRRVRSPGKRGQIQCGALGLRTSVCEIEFRQGSEDP